MIATAGSLHVPGCSRAISVPIRVETGYRVEIFPVEGTDRRWRAHYEISHRTGGIKTPVREGDDGYPNERECVLAFLDRSIFYLSDGTFDLSQLLGFARLEAREDVQQFRDQYAARKVSFVAGEVEATLPARAPALGDPSKFAEGVAQVSQPQTKGESKVITKAKKQKPADSDSKGWDPGEANDIVAGGRDHLRGNPSSPAADVVALESSRPLPMNKHDHADKTVELPLASIVPSPTQPREEFDQKAIEQLADSYTKVGVLQAITVRPSPGLHDSPKYELIAGERRWRAAKLAKLITIPSRIVECTDEEALEIQASENLDREDLNPIERANQYRILLDKGGYTQESLGKRFKISQPEVAHAVSLLRLPESWQKRIMSRDISQTHARELVPWVEFPKILEKLAAVKSDDIGSAADWRRTVADAVHDASRSITYSTYGYGKDFCRFKPTAKQRIDLDIHEVPRRWGNGREKRAFNTKLWSELNNAAKKRADERKKKDAEQTSGPGSGANNAAEYRQREFRRHLYNVKRDWLGRQVVDKLDREKHHTLILKSVLLMEGFVDGAYDLLRKESKRPADLNQFLVDATEAELNRFVFGVVANWLTGECRGYYNDSADWVEKLAEMFKIDMAKSWIPTEDYVTVLLEDKEEFESVLENFFDAGDLESNELTYEKCDANAFIRCWPKGIVPEHILYVTENGDLKRPKKTVAKAKAKR